MHLEGRRPRDSMKSTWRNDKSQWGFAHKFLITLDAFHQYPDQEVPVHAKTDPLPALSQWSTHRYILLRALWPIALQYLYIALTGWRLHPVGAFLLYTVAMQLNSIREVKILRRLAHKYGFLDGDKHERDQVPDAGVDKVFWSVQMTTTIRPMFTIFLAYRSKEPFSLSWWLPLELALYSVVLDFWFYLYHRGCHELDGLWKYHRTHHLTKHPSPLLSSYADSEQEFLEIALIPLLTYGTLKYVFGLPMGFHDWWICHEYIIFAEAFGHSGLRVYSTTPSIVSPLLKLFRCELVVEDHDLHHRKGWRKSQNYGKQTRLWDRIFGTCGERIEAADSNIDYNNSVDFPLW
ncbi:hypothetical protein M409DRAFT_68110 [Zasmidium cellare ATCC 36951]|uniref:Fatty acid hydroxylase domain-containing protein n=1 Tax=Zasmidium cellare ATCC 36951 TaxID=1080233 RepID=A0A6A6CB45_ZASCE|nr:uncharacterized protein M409DRAFT_68110 [Zasmidium cellare ATCC 36951]KAF2164255.1 hypothetical protein M409DRAFT_68110 [Zasmidium cellare ATCC 36951]